MKIKTKTLFHFTDSNIPPIPSETKIIETKEIFNKYHPQETLFSLKVDDEYKKRVEKVLGIKIDQ